MKVNFIDQSRHFSQVSMHWFIARDIFIHNFARIPGIVIVGLVHFFMWGENCDDIFNSEYYHISIVTVYQNSNYLRKNIVFEWLKKHSTCKFTMCIGF